MLIEIFAANLLLAACLMVRDTWVHQGPSCLPLSAHTPTCAPVLVNCADDSSGGAARDCTIAEPIICSVTGQISDAYHNQVYWRVHFHAEVNLLSGEQPQMV